MSLLAVDDLHVQFDVRDAFDGLRLAKALNGVSLSVDRAEVLGLVGETGAGKSLTATAIMGLLRPPARRTRGSIRFDGTELTTLAPDAMNALRGSRIGLVVQSPRTSLDPLARIGDQLVRAQRAHRSVSAAQARQRAVEILASVGIPDPERRASAWPHELSGGMAQRVLIAMALVNDPLLLIADEPTTGLDVTVQAQILDLLREQVASRSLAGLLITHDLGVVAHYCDRVCVMFAGTIVEEGPVEAVFTEPRHPYTVSLLASAPDRVVLGTGRIRAGAPPNLFALPEGCVYQPRCPRAGAECLSRPPAQDFGRGHAASCHRPEAA